MVKWASVFQTQLSLYIDHTLIRWSLDPAAKSLCGGSWWSEKATLFTMSVWCCRTANGFSFFKPNTLMLLSHPAVARIFPSARIRSWETPGLVIWTESCICKETQDRHQSKWAATDKCRTLTNSRKKYFITTAGHKLNIRCEMNRANCHHTRLFISDG